MIEFLLSCVEIFMKWLIGGILIGTVASTYVFIKDKIKKKINYDK